MVIDQIEGATQTSFYVYDGHGSVRALTDPNGNVTDTYDYDAFGNLIHSATTQCATSTGTSTTVTLGAACPSGSTSAPTPNEFLFAGEQFDSDLHLYYNRARYLNVTTGRFWTMDTFEGDPQSPLSLHKYLYASVDPVDRLDPNGNDDIAELTVGIGISETLQTLAVVSTVALVCAVDFRLGGDACADPFKEKIDLYHYTTQENLILIITSGVLNPSFGENAEYGEGQYLTDISPLEANEHTKEALSEALYARPNRWGKSDVGYLEIQFDADEVNRESDVYSPLFPGRGIFLHPSVLPYSLLGTLRGAGSVTFSPF